ncbi:DUF3426 domain-containing protein [Ramlibacter sp.]|uniref:DUF3426 domain-containing protein n=1 Tax=Ramlibacter sp. TaxID=1917967 RepID=UPI003D0D1BA4
MSLITCCPACGTMFKVVPDQLKISDGWVRCGHCSNVFDASAQMVREAAVTSVPVQAPPPPPVPEPAPVPTSPPAPPLPGPGPVREVRSEPATTWQATPKWPPADATDVDSDFAADRAIAAATGADRDPSEFSFPALARREPLPEPEDDFSERISEAAAIERDAEPPLEEVTFVRQARRREFWRRPLVRTVLVLLLFVFAATLALQYAVQERNRLAAQQPALRPVLETLCAVLRCTVGPPRQIESIAIDSSSFNRIRSDTYRLNFTLKNAAALPVALPAVELTLTDAQDQALLRRVLLPSELGASSSLIAPGGEWAGTISLALAGTAAGTRIAGYRLLAFYP